MKHMKVLHIFPEFKRGGAQINVLRFIQFTTEEYDHYVAAAPFDKGLEEEYRREVKEIFPIDMTAVKLSSLFTLAKAIRRLRPDIVHVNGKGAAFYGFASSFLTGKPYRLYHTMRGFHIKYAGWKLKLYLTFEKWAARRMDGNIMVSPSEKRLLNESVRNLKQEKLFLIPNGIEINPEEPLPEEIERSAKKYAVNLVTLSRLSHQKDLITMIDAFDQICGEFPAAGLHILGGETPQDKEYADQVRKRLDASPNKDRIQLWGSVRNAGSLICYFDIYWTTALFEGLPTAVVEAALCRTLIVGTECTGNMDVIFPEETGILTRPGDAASCAEGIREGIRMLGTEKADKLIDRAEALCRDFSLKNNARKLKELYNTGKITP